MESHALRRGEGPFLFVSSSVWGGKLAVASHEGLLDLTVILDGDLRTSDWDNLFLLIVMFLLREPPSLVLAVAVPLTSTESVVGMTLLLITSLLTAMMVFTKGKLGTRLEGI